MIEKDTGCQPWASTPIGTHACTLAHIQNMHVHTHAIHIYTHIKNKYLKEEKLYLDLFSPSGTGGGTQGLGHVRELLLSYDPGQYISHLIATSSRGRV